MASDNTPESDQVPTAPMHAKGPDDEEAGHSPFPIVGIGASAGGLDAFQQLLTNLPAQTGMAFVLVQHLNPHHESRLTELLSRSTSIPVLEASHAMALQSDHVYVIPPASNLAIARGVFQITPRGEERGPHLPVDYLFRSLAEDQKARAIGVVLSGTGSDGTQGLCEIKAVGGITFAQNEQSSRFGGMPMSAFASGCVDFVLAPGEIAQRLAQIGKHPYLVPEAAPAQIPKPAPEAEYQRILSRVRAVTGVDFNLYRDSTIKRRIMRRMALHAHESIESYAARIEADDAEVEALYDDFLINVTSFFRDREVFETLKQLIFPQIIRDKTPQVPVRIWVPGCSTGQEAYSIAMTLVEFFDDRPIRPPIQIFATDLADARSLEKARVGLYPETIEAEVSPERLRRFFVKEDHTYRINKSIRDLCVFARQNIAADPPFSRVDLISCRNVLIYLTTALQQRVLPTFHYALNTPGFLFLGSAESVGDNTDLFELVDRTQKIYAKKPTASRPHFQFPYDEYASHPPPGLRRHSASGEAPAEFQREADRILLGRYSPPGVLVNEDLSILQFRGRTSPYLELPPGEPTTNLLKMAREGLFLELRNACAEAIKQNQPARRDRVRVRANGEIHEITLEVLPVRPPGSNQKCLLILFHERESAAQARRDALGSPELKSDPGASTASELEQELLQARRELAATKEYLQSMVEQQDAANEELRSANEEILSSNEELQSTNEELETAKEELQSTNEELTTVNEQLQFRNLELNQTTNDLTNLLTSAGIPVVMVGPDLRVRRFTASARKTMNLLASDIGRPIGDLKQSADVPDLEELIGEVIDQVQVRQREIRDHEGSWHLLRIHPYRTSENKIDGAVILLLDIDEIKRGQEALRESEAQLRLALEAGSAGTWVRDLKSGRETWDVVAKKIFGLPADAEFLRFVHPSDVQRLVEARDRAILQHEKFTEEIRIVRPNGEIIWLLLGGQASYEASGEPLLLGGICIDISERKRLAAAEQLHIDELKEIDRRKDEFLAMLAHELRNPLAPLQNAAHMLRLPTISPTQAGWCREVIERQVQQMTHLLDDLLDVSRITRDILHFHPERSELGKIIADALEESAPLIETQGLELRVELPDQAVYLEADPARLTQVFSNLLNNAAKYTPPEGHIDLSARREDDSIVVSVEDSGSGIAQELLPRVFDIFVRGEESGTSAHAGLGIGLALAKRLVEMHNGTIEAKSEGPGQGSSFTVRLPLAQEDGTPRAESITAHPHTGQVQAPKRILVVDDRPAQAQSLAMLLEIMGHQVRIAHNGDTALQIADEFAPEVGLIDIGLPGMSGYDLARRLRAQPRFKNMLLIAQTGWGRDEDRQSSREAGFDHHMAKPIDHQALFRLLAAPRGDH